MEWIKIEDGLPDLIKKNGPVNYVFTRWKRTKDKVGISSAEYVNKYPDEISHWMYIPEVEPEEPPLTNKELKQIRALLIMHDMA